MSKKINIKEPKSSEIFRKGFLFDKKMSINTKKSTYDLHYIDNEEKSDAVIFLIPGLGLDYSDFYEFVRNTKYRVIGLTLYGSHQSDVANESICVNEHAIIIQKFIYKHLKNQTSTYENSIVVGFSLGADILLRIASNKNKLIKKTKIHFLLLDPNINIDTCFISSQIAQITQIDFQKQICEILARFINDKTSFNQILNYVNTISPKFYNRTTYLSFLAKSMICSFQACLKDKNEFFNKMLSKVYKIDKNSKRIIKIQFSKNREAQNYIGTISKSTLPVKVKKRLLDNNVIEITDNDHFSLISKRLLDLTIEKLLEEI